MGLIAAHGGREGQRKSSGGGQPLMETLLEILGGFFFTFHTLIRPSFPRSSSFSLQPVGSHLSQWSLTCDAPGGVVGAVGPSGGEGR